MKRSLGWFLGSVAAGSLLVGCVAVVDPYPSVYVPVPGPRIVVAPPPVVVAPRPWGRYGHRGYGWERRGHR
jgi:hypothetical protein